MDQKAKQVTEKDTERDWIREQIDKFYYDAYPVSSIVNVNINLEHTEKDELKVKFVKQEMLQLFDAKLRTGLKLREGGDLRISYETSKSAGDLPQFWISRDGHHEYIKAQYVKAIVDQCNAEFKKWPGMKTKPWWRSVQAASIAFLSMKPNDFKVLTIVVPEDLMDV